MKKDASEHENELEERNQSRFIDLLGPPLRASAINIDTFPMAGNRRLSRYRFAIAKAVNSRAES